MVKIFKISSAEEPRTPAYDEIFSIRPSQIDNNESKLRFFDDNLPLVNICSAGRQWTDCITPKVSLAHGLVVSERIIESVVSNGLTGLNIWKADLDFSTMRRVFMKSNGAYFLVSPFGATPPVFHRVYELIGDDYELRFESLDIKNDPRCQSFHAADGFVPHIKSILSDANWEGDDFMKTRSISNGVSSFGAFYCSRKVVEIARRESWSNFCFYPFDRMGSAWGDFRKFSWPPENWYPENQPL